MGPHDEQAGERLWSQIEALKTGTSVDKHVASGGSDDLSSVVHAVDNVMRKDIARSDGQLTARSRLQAAIHSDLAKKKARRLFGFDLSLLWPNFRRHQRLVFTTLLLVLALSALAYDAWNEYQKAYCHKQVTSPTKQ